MGRSENGGLAAWLASEQRGWEAIERLVAELTPAEAAVVGYLPGWSVKDLVAHLAGWAAEAGMELERAEPGSGSIDLPVDAKNRIFVDANRDQPLEVVLGEARTARNRMIQDLRSLGRIPEAAARAVRKAGPEHYLEHLPRLQQWVAELRSGAGIPSGRSVRRPETSAAGDSPGSVVPLAAGGHH